MHNKIILTILSNKEYKGIINGKECNEILNGKECKGITKNSTNSTVLLNIIKFLTHFRGQTAYKVKSRL